MRRSVMMLITLFAGACFLRAQTPSPLSSEAKQAYTGIKNNLIRMAEKVPEEHYAFKATPEVRPFSEIIAHVADYQVRACAAVQGQPKAVNAASKTTKADLVAAVKEAFAICDAAFDMVTDANAAEMVPVGNRQRSKLGALYTVITHGNEEYGYMAVYLRLKGIVPPSSE